MKRPAFQFYPSDWRTDVELQSCSITARGVWHELLCVMHDCKPYGHLVLPNGQAMTEEQASRIIGTNLKTFRKSLAELEAVNVFSRLKDGTIYSRRMVKDERLRNARAEAGHKGGNPILLNQKVNDTDNQQSNQSLTPSSSSSSSSSNRVVEGDTLAGGADQSPPGEISPNGKIKSELPKGWHRSDEGIDKAGRMLGVKPKLGEDYDAFKQRIFDHIRKGAH